MKKANFLVSVICSTLLYANAQDCNNYLMMQQGKTIEMTTTNAKGKLSSKNIYTISDVNKSGAAASSTVNFSMTDSKEKPVANGKLSMQCSGGLYKVDMRSFVPAQNLEQMDGFDAEGAFYITFPGNMQVGDALEAGEANVATSTNGMKISNEITITDRKVTGKASVTTPAGTWECFTITSLTTIRTKIGAVGIPLKINGTEYFAPGIGIIKSESKYGKTELTAIK